MKKNLTKILIIIFSGFVIAVIVRAANTFPTTLNDWDDGDIIESDWADAIEAKIGINSSSVITSLDYKVLNYASRSLDQTLTGNWVNTANPWADNEVINTLTIDGGIVTWTDLTTYPTGCSAGQFVSTVGDTLTCGTPATGASSNSLNFDEFQNPLVLDTNITTTSASFNWDFGGTNFATIGSASFTRGLKIANVTGDNLFRITSAGTVNAGLWQGTAVTDTYVNDAISIIGGTIGANSISGTQTTTGTTTFGDNGDNIVFDSNTWDITGAGAGSGFTQFTVDNLDLNLNSFISTTGGITIAPNSLLTNFTGSASVSVNFEVVGYASASKYFGTALTGCSSDGSQLLWTAATGLFSCQSLVDADIPDTLTITNLSGTNTGDITLAGTPNYLTLANQVITLTKLDISDDTNMTAGTDLTLTTNDLTLDSTLTQAFSFTNTGSQSMTGSLNVAKGIHQTGATMGLTFDGKLTGFSATASNSIGGSFEPKTTGIGSLGTTALKWAQLVANKVIAVVQLLIPSGTGGSTTGTVAGSLGVDTASRTLNFGDGTNENVIDPRKCVATNLRGSNLTAKGQFTIFTPDNPYTITLVQVTASGTNALGWNLMTGSATVPTTNVFTLDKSASGSAVVKYTSFGTATVGDGGKLDFVVSSKSATLNSTYVRVCGYLDP